MKTIKKCGSWFVSECKWACEYQILHLRVFWKEVGTMFDNSIQGLAYRLVFLVGLVTILFWLAVGISTAYKVIIAELPFTREYIAGKIFKVERTIIVPAIAKKAAVEPESNMQEVHNTAVYDVVRKVYQLESSSGKNDFSKCVEAGKFNGYGFSIPGDGTYKCFDSHEDATKKVEDWFADKLTKHDLPTSICGYNLGFQSEHLEECKKSSPDYPYYRDFLTL